MIKLHVNEWLEKKHWSQRKLATLAGLRPNTVNALCREQVSRIDFDTLESLCRIFECEPGDLLTYVPVSTDAV